MVSSGCSGHHGGVAPATDGRWAGLQVYEAVGMRDRKLLDLVRHIDDAPRLRALAARASPVRCPLVLTVSGLSDARAAAGRHAGPQAILQAAADAQGAGRGPWESRLCAEQTMLLVSRCLPSGTSFGSRPMGFVFVNVLRAPREADMMLGLAGTMAAAYAAMDCCVLHEAGHTAEAGMGMQMGLADLAGVPAEVRVPGIGMCHLRNYMRWHASECFADAFGSLSALAAGVPSGIVSARPWMVASTLADARTGGGLAGEPFWSAYRFWRGVYCTMPAVALALRHPPRQGAAGRAIADAALGAARRGMLPPEDMLEISAGVLPGWLPEFDRGGMLPRFRDRLAVPACREDIAAIPLRGGGPGAAILELAARQFAVPSRRLRLHPGAGMAAQRSLSLLFSREVLGIPEPAPRQVSVPRQPAPQPAAALAPCH